MSSGADKVIRKRGDDGKFRTLHVYQKALELSKEVRKITKTFPKMSYSA